MEGVTIKRIYEPAAKTDGYRVLVDRLWPRGIRKEDAGINDWVKEIAPSTALRKWFDHDPQKWQQFQRDYFTELAQNKLVTILVSLITEHKQLTLLYAAKDEQHNHALVLQRFLQALLK